MPRYIKAEVVILAVKKFVVIFVAIFFMFSISAGIVISQENLKMVITNVEVYSGNAEIQKQNEGEYVVTLKDTFAKIFLTFELQNLSSQPQEFNWGELSLQLTIENPDGKADVSNYPVNLVSDLKKVIIPAHEVLKFWVKIPEDLGEIQKYYDPEGPDDGRWAIKVSVPVGRDKEIAVSPKPLYISVNTTPQETPQGGPDIWY